MKKIVTAIAALLILASCAKQELAEEVLIEGNVRNLPDGPVYLAEAHSWKNIDSAQSRDGRFVFRVRPDSSFTPSQVAIQYRDPGADSVARLIMFRGYRRLFFRNHMLGADSLRAYEASFFLERHPVRMEGDATGKGKVRVFAGRQTEAQFSNMYTYFGRLGNVEGEGRLAKVESFKQEVRKHPYSHYLLNELYNYKEQFSEQELQELTELFDREVRESALGEKIRLYQVNRVDPNLPYANHTLPRPDGKQGWVMGNGAKVNMLVFWASWCRPCREEIPQLREIYRERGGKGLHLVSISIDERQENWQRALSQERMEWPQFIVEKDQIETYKQRFNFSAIPVVILTDSKGKEIKRFVGSGEENLRLINAALDSHLSKSSF